MMAECLPTTRGQSHGLSPMRVTLGSNDLLEYNPDYGVLICRDCEYAIQKSAVSLLKITIPCRPTDDIFRYKAIYCDTKSIAANARICCLL